MIPLYDINPTRRRPVVTYTLIALNVLVYFGQYVLETGLGAIWVVPAYGLVPSRITYDPAGEAFTVLTSMFMHGDWAHLGWNMLFLHVFGDNVEDRLGRWRYLGFYMIGGFGAAVAQYALDPLNTIPMVGASGAIAAVLGGYLVVFPRAPVVVLNPLILLWLLMGPYLTLPAWLIVGEWFVGNLMGGLVSLGGQGGGVAFFAHLGGFIVGLLLVKPLLARAAREREPSIQSPPRPRPHRGPFWREDEDRPFWK